MIVGSRDKIADKWAHILKNKTRPRSEVGISLRDARCLWNFGDLARHPRMPISESPFSSIPTLNTGRQSVGSLDMSARDESRALSCGEILRGVFRMTSGYFQFTRSRQSAYPSCEGVTKFFLKPSQSAVSRLLYDVVQKKTRYRTSILSGNRLSHFLSAFLSAAAAVPDSVSKPYLSAVLPITIARRYSSNMIKTKTIGIAKVFFVTRMTA